MDPRDQQRTCCPSPRPPHTSEGRLHLLSAVFSEGRVAYEHKATNHKFPTAVNPINAEKYEDTLQFPMEAKQKIS